MAALAGSNLRNLHFSYEMRIIVLPWQFWAAESLLSARNCDACAWESGEHNYGRA